MLKQKLVSWISVWLPRRGHRLYRLRLGAIERALRRMYDRHALPVDTLLHGFPARINAGNPYPFFAAQLSRFNQPLVDLVRETSVVRGRGVAVIDVGAAIGDTVLLLQQRVPNSLASIDCVEPEPGFVRLFIYNTARFPAIRLHEAMLARAPGPIRELVHNHAGTATAAGDKTATATTLDELLLRTRPRFDVLKIDIDGSDGEALAGAAALLQRDRPAVIFEWHPALVARAGHDPRVGFAALQAAGYRRLLWFRNEGSFSHFSRPDDPEIPTWNDFLIRMQSKGDPHFDVVALPPDLEHLAATLASGGALSAEALPLK